MLPGGGKLECTQAREARSTREQQLLRAWDAEMRAFGPDVRCVSITHVACSAVAHCSREAQICKAPRWRFE